MFVTARKQVRKKLKTMKVNNEGKIHYLFPCFPVKEKLNWVSHKIKKNIILKIPSKLVSMGRPLGIVRYLPLNLVPCSTISK